MPTADPIKRRQQNCENQKRWRQRQLDELRRLSTALDESRNRIQELEAESDKLRGALRITLAAVRRLRMINGARNKQTEDSVNPSQALPNDMGLATEEYHNFSMTVSGCRRPLIRVLEIDGMESSNTGVSNGPAIAGEFEDLTDVLIGFEAESQKLPSYASSSEENANVWKSIVIADDDDDNDNDEPEAIELACLLGNFPEEADLFTHHHDCESTAEPQDVPMEREEDEVPAIVYEVPSTKDEIMPFVDQSWSHGCFEALFPTQYPVTTDESLENDEAAPQEATRIDYNTASTLFDWSPDAMVGGTRGIWQRMSNFSDNTRISKHISAVQTVLGGALAQLIRRSSIDREKIVAEAFSWMIHSAWPSCEGCFKMMTIYRHIYTFELWRSFPCPATYYGLHPLYRPTVLQLLVPHSPAIDWLPWPALRDKVIRMQHQVDVDQLCLMALENTVIEPNFSSTTTIHDSTSISTFRIWDMYLVEKAAGGSFSSSSTSMTHHPESPNLQALVKAYKLPLQDITHLRIDAPFFNIFPEILFPGCTSRFQTTPLNMEYCERLEYPSDLTHTSVQILQSQIFDHLGPTTE